MSLDLNFAIPVMGAAFIFLGLYMRLGNMKRVYWKSRRSMMGYIPLGLVFLAAGFYDLASKQVPWIFYTYIAFFALLGGLTLWMGTKPPEFMKPTWIKWVEKYPKSIQKAMAADVEENEDWKKNVVNQAAVDAWAKQLSRKLPRKK